MSAMRNRFADGLAATPWFDETTRPMRPGVYARRAPAGPFACWDGTRWRADAAEPAKAAKETSASRYGVSSWRGLTAPSNAPCVTCRGHTVLDSGVDVDSGVDLIEECPDC